MKKLLALAAFLLASSTAQAQYQFEYGGRTIKIDPDRGTVSIPGVYDNSGKKAKRASPDAFTDIWKRVDLAISGVLDRTTFAELVRRWKEMQTRYVPNWEI